MMKQIGGAEDKIAELKGKYKVTEDSLDRVKKQARDMILGLKERISKFEEATLDSLRGNENGSQIEKLGEMLGEQVSAIEKATVATKRGIEAINGVLKKHKEKVDDLDAMVSIINKRKTEIDMDLVNMRKDIGDSECNGSLVKDIRKRQDLSEAKQKELEQRTTKIEKDSEANRQSTTDTIDQRIKLYDEENKKLIRSCESDTGEMEYKLDEIETKNVKVSKEMSYATQDIKSAVRKIDLKANTLQAVAKKLTPMVTEIQKAQDQQRDLDNENKPERYRVCVKLDGVWKKIDCLEMGEKIDELHGKKVTESIIYSVKGYVSVLLNDKEIAEKASEWIPKIDPTYSELNTKTLCKAVLKDIANNVLIEEIEEYISETRGVVLHCKPKIMSKGENYQTILVTFNNAEDYAKCRGRLCIGYQRTYMSPYVPKLIPTEGIKKIQKRIRDLDEQTRKETEIQREIPDSTVQTQKANMRKLTEQVPTMPTYPNKMIMIYKVCQLNCHNSELATRQILQRTETDILLLQEPYYTKNGPIRDPEWIPIHKEGEHCRAITYIKSKSDISSKTTKIEHLTSRDITAIQTDDITIINVYNQQEENNKYPGTPALKFLEQNQTEKYQKTIIAGDFNLHSHEQDLRAREENMPPELVQWLHSNDMILCSPEGEPIYNKDTVIDVPYASIDVIERIHFKRIDSDSFNDHYILDWEISSTKRLPEKELSPLTRHTIKEESWKEVDDLLTKIINEVNINDKLPENKDQAEAMAVNVERAINKAIRESVTKIQLVQKSKRHLNGELRGVQKEAIMARRNAKQRQPTIFMKQEAIQVAKNETKAFKIAMRNATNTQWNAFLEGIEGTEVMKVLKCIKPKSYNTLDLSMLLASEIASRYYPNTSSDITLKARY